MKLVDYVSVVKNIPKIQISNQIVRRSLRKPIIKKCYTSDVYVHFLGIRSVTCCLGIKIGHSSRGFQVQNRFPCTCWKYERNIFVEKYQKPRWNLNISTSNL